MTYCLFASSPLLKSYFHQTNPVISLKPPRGSVKHDGKCMRDHIKESKFSPYLAAKRDFKKNFFSLLGFELRAAC
jgi:hypothetical protein